VKASQQARAQYARRYAVIAGKYIEPAEHPDAAIIGVGENPNIAGNEERSLRRMERHLTPQV